MGKRYALIGLDGSGKSANISKMKQDPSFSAFQFVWVRWKPTLLKPAYLLLGYKLKKKKKQTDAHADQDARSALHEDHTAKSGIKSRVFGSALIRNVWLFCALTDYLLQFYIKLLPLLIRGDNIIFDRYYLDLFVDQGINFGFAPEKIGDLIEKHRSLFPKIDGYIYVRVSPEVCYSRKDDIPNIEYLDKRYEIYEYQSKNRDWICVDGEKPFEEVYSQIREIILR